MKLDPVPEELNVTDLEQQLFAPNLIFMKIKRMPTSRMKCIVDKIVNVPLHSEDIEKSLNKISKSVLPRPLNEAGIVEIKLKRKLEMKNSYSNKYIRANVPRNAVLKLKELNNPHFAHVTVREESEMEVDSEPEDTKPVDDEENDSDDEPAGFGTNAEVLRNAATCLLPENREAEMIINDTGKTIHNVVKIAPGEGKIPQNYLREENFDVKAFPRHHPTGSYGLDHPRERKIPAQKFFCQRLLNRDPRFANDMSYLFMAQQRVERAALESQLRLAGRKGKIQGNNGPNKKFI